METKIITSMYWKKQTRFLMFMDVLIVFAVVIFSVLYRDLEMFIVLGCCTLVYILVTLSLVYISRRLLTEVFIIETCFQSVLFNKEIALVNSEQTVYYAVFEEAEGVYSRARFILISNSPFKYEPRKSIFSKSMLGRYDIRTQVLIPYNSNTMKYFDLENWICVN